MFQKVDAPRYQENLYMKVIRLSAVRTGHLYGPRKYPWYVFTLENKSIPRPKDYVNENFLSYHREKNPQPSGL